MSGDPFIYPVMRHETSARCWKPEEGSIIRAIVVKLSLPNQESGEYDKKYAWSRKHNYSLCSSLSWLDGMSPGRPFSQRNKYVCSNM